MIIHELARYQAAWCFALPGTSASIMYLYLTINACFVGIFRTELLFFYWITLKFDTVGFVCRFFKKIVLTETMAKFNKEFYLHASAFVKFYSFFFF